MIKSYSQNNEQEIILEHLNNFNNGFAGKFIDIGAYDPFVFSNTRCLYERGWRGYFIEPSPTCYAKFKETYKNDTRVQAFNFAIGTHDGTVTFYDSCGDAVSTTSIEHKVKWEQGANVTFTPIIVPCVAMQKFLNEHGADCDFISIDTEGTNYQLFLLLPDAFLHRLKMICIEHDGYNQHIEHKLKSFGFKTVLTNNENLIMVK
jgi:FkbM family methyltransferase